MQNKLLLLVATITLVCACNNPSLGLDTPRGETDDKTGKDYRASAKTLPATDITMSSAVLNGNVSVGNPSYSSIEFGILISNTQANITSHIGQRLKYSKQILGDFSVKITGLSEKTTYYYQTYLILDGSQVKFGQPEQFVTKGSSKGSENGHDYVDLGLSVKWATMNIGAAYPERIGNYYAWGETTSKSLDKYSWSSYKWGDPDKGGITKYNNDSFNGKVDNLNTLELADDVAHAIWGGRWRMPTRAEWAELINNCRWEWTTSYGIGGYEVISSDGNKIFLPAGGVVSNGSQSKYGTVGRFWSSTLNEYNTGLAYQFGFDSSGIEKKVDWSYPRHVGLSVRAVCP